MHGGLLLVSYEMYEICRGIQWGGTAGGDKKKTGGSNFQTPVAPATMIPMNQTGVSSFFY